ncbi:MOS1T transposase, partial [Pseudoatta argentina]
MDLEDICPRGKDRRLAAPQDHWSSMIRCEARSLDRAFSGLEIITSVPPSSSFLSDTCSRSLNDAFCDVIWNALSMELVGSAGCNLLSTITGDRYRLKLMRLSRALKEKRPLYAQRHDKVILLHDNARPHVAKPVKTYLETPKWEVLPHPPYSPDIAPSDFHLF